MRPMACFCEFRARSRVYFSLAMLLGAGMAAPALALTTEDLQGDFELIALTVDYVGAFPPALTEKDLTSLTGNFSATAKTLLVEHAGRNVSSNTTFQQRTAGIYQLSGRNAKVDVVGGPPRCKSGGTELTLQIVPSSSHLKVTGCAVDSFDREYLYTATFSRQETYYSRAQLEEAIANTKPKVVILPLFD